MGTTLSLPNSRFVPSPRCSNKYYCSTILCKHIEACTSCDMHVHVRALAPTILPLSTDCIRSRHARRRCAFDQRSVGHLRERSVVRLITPKVLKEARRCELVLKDSFPFRWSASEVQAKWPVSAHTHRHSCWTDSKSFENPQLVWTGMWNLQRRSNGERQTNRARIKALWTH